MSARATPLGELRAVVLAAAGELESSSGRPAVAPTGITLERPPRPDFGDYSTNAALLMAPILASSPREVAQRLGKKLQERLGAELERFEVAGPGFLNLFLA